MSSETVKSPVTAKAYLPEATYFENLEERDTGKKKGGKPRRKTKTSTHKGTFGYNMTRIAGKGTSEAVVKEMWWDEKKTTTKTQPLGVWLADKTKGHVIFEAWGGSAVATDFVDGFASWFNADKRSKPTGLVLDSRITDAAYTPPSIPTSKFNSCT